MFIECRAEDYIKAGETASYLGEFTGLAKKRPLPDDAAPVMLAFAGEWLSFESQVSDGNVSGRTAAEVHDGNVGTGFVNGATGAAVNNLFNDMWGELNAMGARILKAGAKSDVDFDNAWGAHFRSRGVPENQIASRVAEIRNLSFGTGGNVRNVTERATFLKGLIPKAPAWMKQWLQQGKVPPGYNVDHIKPLSAGGADKPSNMRLLDVEMHKTHYQFYHPWRD